MDDKTRELIAIGASVTAHCVPCLKYHYHKAQEAGATLEEVQEAIETGRMVRSGAARAWEKEAMEIVQGLKDS